MVKYILFVALAFYLVSCSGGDRFGKAGNGTSGGGFGKGRNGKFEISGIDTANMSKAALDFFIRGINLHQQGRFAEAVLEFQDALKYDSSASLDYYIARSYKEAYKFNHAIDYVLKCLEKDSTFVPGLELLAEVYMIQYKPKDAASVYEQIIKLKPEKYYMLTLARLYEYSNHQKAIKIYEEILNSGDDINILTRLAAIYEDNKNDEEYDKAIDRIYKAFPDNPRTLLPVMESYLKRKKFGTALSVLYKVQQTVLESDLDIYFNIAGEYLLEDTSSATTSIYIPKYLSYVDNRFYFSWRMQLLSGLLQMKLKDTVKAEKTLLHCLDISDTMPDVVLEVVLFYTRSKDYIKSNKMINDYRTQFPNDWRFPFYQGFNFYNLNDDMNAIKAYNQSIALDPTRVDTYVQLGMSFDRLKLYDSTLAVYDRALKLKPDDPTLNNNYAYTLSELGKNLDLAIDMIKIALSADSSNISFLDTYAWIQFKLGNYGQALEYIQKAINTGSVHAEVYEHLGDIYMKMDKKNEAIEAWREGLKIESNNQPLLERLEKVK